MSHFSKYFLEATGSTGYFKCREGVNVIRILSDPLEGWQVWESGRVSRFPIENKPDVPNADSCQPFCNYIIWNYALHAIQVFNVTQATLYKPFAEFSDDPDWGRLDQYDLKIKKTGDGLQTKYVVTPSPKSPLTEEIKQAFYNTPCWLPATFQNDDPFNQGKTSTPSLFDSILPKKVGLEKLQLLKEMLNQDVDYLDKVQKGVFQTYGVQDFSHLTEEQFEKVLNQVKLYFEEKDKKELSHNDEVPF